mgnify:CR=1 FL=1
MKKEAIIEGNYRYSLIREWDENNPNRIVFIMLNPSVADSEVDDRTTKRCISFARKWGYGSLEIVNLFAYISQEYEVLKYLDKHEAIGVNNNKYIKQALERGKTIVAAWGENGVIHGRCEDFELYSLLRQYKIYCLGRTRDGHPRHPLFVKSDKQLEEFVIPQRTRLTRTMNHMVEEASREGLLVDKEGKVISGDAWMWCEMCHGEFRISNYPVCENCLGEYKKKHS